MYMISITLMENHSTDTQDTKMFRQHKAWFQKHFQLGHFLIMGPYLDAKHAGIIVARAKNRDVLDAIISEDVYYPTGLADYQIREFSPILIAENISDTPLAVITGGNEADLK